MPGYNRVKTHKERWDNRWKPRFSSSAASANSPRRTFDCGQCFPLERGRDRPLAGVASERRRSSGPRGAGRTSSAPWRTYISGLTISTWTRTMTATAEHRSLRLPARLRGLRRGHTHTPPGQVGGAVFVHHLAVQQHPAHKGHSGKALRRSTATRWRPPGARRARSRRRSAWRSSMRPTSRRCTRATGRPTYSLRRRPSLPASSTSKKTGLLPCTEGEGGAQESSTAWATRSPTASCSSACTSLTPSQWTCG